MTREELIAKCRYYKGENICPDDKRDTLWFYEMAWVNAKMSDYDFKNEILEYKFYVGESADDAPLSLKALLFNRYAHWGQPDADGFRDWYRCTYLMER